MCLKKGTEHEPIRPLPPPRLNSQVAYRYFASGGRGLMNRKIIVQNLGLNKLQIGTIAEAAGGLWVHGLWRDEYPGL